MTRLSRTAIFFCLANAIAIFLAAENSVAADPPSDGAKADTSAAPPKIIKPPEAKDYEGQVVTVEFPVVAGRELDSGRCFLNSSTDRNDPTSFTAYITPKGLGEFKKDPKTEKPAEYFKSKTIRVTGKVETYQNKYEIKVDDPTQIKIVEEKTDENAGKKS